MAKEVEVSWYDELGGNDGTLSVWLIDAKGLFAVGRDLEETWFTIFKDEETDAFIGVETLFPITVPRCIDILRADPLHLVDVPQAGLKDVHPAEALLWGFQTLKRGRIPTKSRFIQTSGQRLHRSIYS